MRAMLCQMLPVAGHRLLEASRQGAATALNAQFAPTPAVPPTTAPLCSAGHYSAGHMARGLRSAAEAGHLGRVRAALPPAVRVTNSRTEWERAVVRLQAQFEISLRHERL